MAAEIEGRKPPPLEWPDDPAGLDELIRLARAEDWGERGDLSTRAVAGKRPSLRAAARARLLAKQAGVVCGLAVVPHLIRDAEDRTLSFAPGELCDGDRIEPGTVLGTLAGPWDAILLHERLLLNFLQRLSGVASLTRRFVDAVAGTTTDIYDTRKTTPGWRHLEKYAVRCGGGQNHRMGLHDAVLIKDNHLAGVPTERLAQCAFEILNDLASLDPPPEFVEFEVQTLEQLDELLKVVGIDVIMLDNFTPENLRAAVAQRDRLGLRGKVALEASGNVDLQSVRDVAATGVERIAVGALTHSAPALDVSLEMAHPVGSV